MLHKRRVKELLRKKIPPKPSLAQTRIKTFLPFLKLSESALEHSQFLWSNCQSQHLKQRGQELTAKERSDAKYGLSLENAGFPFRPLWMQSARS